MWNTIFKGPQSPMSCITLWPLIHIPRFTQQLKPTDYKYWLENVTLGPFAISTTVCPVTVTEALVESPTVSAGGRTPSASSSIEKSSPPAPSGTTNALDSSPLSPLQGPLKLFQLQQTLGLHCLLPQLAFRAICPAALWLLLAPVVSPNVTTLGCLPPAGTIPTVAATAYCLMSLPASSSAFSPGYEFIRDGIRSVLLH
jgi:hypothetical protein